MHSRMYNRIIAFRRAYLRHAPFMGTHALHDSFDRRYGRTAVRIVACIYSAVRPTRMDNIPSVGTQLESV